MSKFIRLKLLLYFYNSGFSYSSTMFIRKTHIPGRDKEKTYFNYQLVESYRTDRGPRQRILLNMGPNLDLDKAELKTLANRIEEILKGMNTLFSNDDKIEQLAQKYASQLVRDLSDEPPSSNPTQASFQTIDMDTIEHLEPRSVGAEHILLNFASELKLPKKLKELGFSEKEVALNLSTIIARAVFPARATSK